MIRNEFPYTPHAGPLNPSHEGMRSARILCVPESPWKTEAALHRPLVGASGQKWEEWLMKAGILRNDLRIENLYPYKPPTREITSVKDADLVYWINDLHRRIAEMPNLWLIVTMGNYATFALTGKGKVRASLRNQFSQLQASITEAEKKAGISSLRGSVYLYQDLNGRQIKVIPTIHPAAALQHPKWEKRCILDWKRVREEGKFPKYVVPQRKHVIDPSEWEVANYVKFVERNAPALLLSTDIETWGRTLSCVGFAYSPYESITLPTTGEKRDVFLPYVKRLCECGAAKILCNGNFDWFWLDAYGVQLANFLWDVQLMHHAIDPIESHSLEFLASIYTKEPYWKDESKEAEEIVKYARKQESLWIYNGKDCCVTYEVKEVLEKVLREKEMLEFYFQHYQRLIEPLLRMMRHGVRVDRKMQKDWRKKLLADMKKVRAKLEEGAGENLFATERKGYWREPSEAEWGELLVEGEIEYTDAGIPKAKFIDREARKLLIAERDITYCISGANAGKFKCYREIDKKDFSNAKLMKFFNETLGIPKQYKRRKGKKKPTPTLDEGAIRKMINKWPGKMGKFGEWLLEYREKKRESDYLKGAWDKDGRIRCSYKMITEAGRLASAKNPMGKGYNLQNLKR